MIKRHLLLITPLMILLLIIWQIENELKTDVLFMFIGLQQIALGLWRPQLDRFLQPDKRPDGRWDYQWMRAFSICFGLGFLVSAILNLVSRNSSFITFSMIAIGFLLNPVFYAMAVRRSGEPALLRDVLSVIGVALFGLAVVSPLLFIEFTGGLTWTACIPFVPGLALILVSLLIPSDQQNAMQRGGEG